MMETIRVTEDQQRRIAQAAAASPEKNKQRFCIAAIMGRVEAWENRPIPAGCVRLHPFQQPAIDIPRATEFGNLAVEISQFQTEGNWYFHDRTGQVVGMWEDKGMQKFLPDPNLEHTVTNAS